MARVKQRAFTTNRLSIALSLIYMKSLVIMTDTKILGMKYLRGWKTWVVLII